MKDLKDKRHTYGIIGFHTTTKENMKNVLREDLNTLETGQEIDKLKNDARRQ